MIGPFLAAWFFVAVQAPIPAPPPVTVAPAFRVIEVGGGAHGFAQQRAIATGRAPLPAGPGSAPLVVRKGETILLRVAAGRTITSVTLDRPGIVTLNPAGPSLVRLMGVETGIVRITVETGK